MKTIFSILTVVVISTSVALAQNGGGDSSGDETHCPDNKHVDCRTSFEASFYVGAAVDTFAGDATLNYLNTNAQSQSTWREVAGFDFAYRLYGHREYFDDTAVKPRYTNYSQLWVYGETVHGVRSKEVQCTDANGQPTPFSNLSACKQTDIGGTPPNVDQLVAIIKGASSLEAFAGLRWEVMPFGSLLQGREADRARLYVKAQIGTLDVTGGGKAATESLISVGAIAVSGVFNGSYFEIGRGRNDLFVKHRGNRLKMDAFLSVDPAAVPILDKIKNTSVRPFAQITVDNGRGHSDSYQTYLGLDYVLGR